MGNIQHEKYPPEYFSGCSINIYFNDVLVDEIVQLEFNLQEQIMPVQGFNSRTFDEVIRGARMVQGSFAINFKQRDYLKFIAQRIQEGDTEDLKHSKDKENEDGEKKFTNQNVYGAEKLKDAFYDDNEEFKNMTEENNESIWNSKSVDKNTSSCGRVSSLPRSGFDITIDYGYSRQRHGQAQSFHESEGTIKSINDIYLTGMAQTLELSGEPVKEFYTFIAKDIDKGVVS